MSASVFEEYSSESSQSWVFNTLIFVEPYHVNLLVGTGKTVSIPEISDQFFSSYLRNFCSGWLSQSLARPIGKAEELLYEARLCKRRGFGYYCRWRSPDTSRG